MRLLYVHAITLWRELSRQPMYVTSTLVFPSLFFWFFGVPNARDSDGLALLTASFCAFGVLGVVLFQFGVAVAQEKEGSWYSYQRSLPAHPVVIWGAQVLVGAVFACASAGCVLITARLAGEMNWASYQWGTFFATLLAGGVPFALLGISLGLIVNRHAAVPVMNLVYLPLSFAGGLWMPPEVLPRLVRDISPFLPTRHYGELVWAALGGRAVPTGSIVALAGWGVGGVLVLAWLTRREEARSFT